jgi:uncharacterized protein involved in type VI secretion and phage assembly
MAPLVYFASVVDTKDPLALGRVQVTLKGFPADVALTDVWLRMLSPAASASTGFNWLPEVGDEVAILRGAGDTLEGMLILGAVYNGKAKPLYSNADGDNITKELRTKAGNCLTFTDTAGEEVITISTAGAKITISMANASDGTVTIEGADKVIVKAVTSMTFDAKDIKVTGSSSVEVTAGAASVKLADGNLDLGGGEVAVTGKSKVAVSAPAINLG